MKKPTLMQQSTVRVADVDASKRLRPVSEAGVESLIASILETGVMKDAIHVRKRKDARLVLIAGAHRLEAAKRLGWEEVEAKVWTDVTDDWARLMEIDDNLAGAEMNALDTAIFLAERKTVYERLHPETKADAFKGNQHTGKVAADIMSVSSFAAATAEKFGLTDRHVRRLIAVGTALHASEVKLLRAAPAQVKLADLQALAKIGDAVERQRVVEIFSDGQAKGIADARQRYTASEGGIEGPVKDAGEEALKALAKLWARTPLAAKRRFVAEHFDEIDRLTVDELHNRAKTSPLGASSVADDTNGEAME